MLRLILNILWFIWGGWLAGIMWLIGGLILAVTIVGLPYTFAAWRIAGFAFWPFGKKIVHRHELGKHDIGTGPIGILLNVIWFLLAGWYIALTHLIVAVTEAISIIGIPFALKDLQLAQIAFAPVGMEVVDV